MDFTKEQQEHIDKLIGAATSSLYTEDELERRVTAEADRRVESGIQKGLETHRVKWEKDYEEKAKLTAEEIARLELQEQMDELANQKAEIDRRSNSIDARDKLTEAGIPKEDYSKFLNLLVSEDSEETEKRVNDFVETFQSTRKNIESTIRKEMSNIPPPSDNSGNSNSAGGSGVNDFISMAQQANIRK